jgi:hypothetical protein
MSKSIQPQRQPTPEDAQGRRLIRVGEWRSYFGISIIVLIALFALNYFSLLVVLPLCILAIGCFKHFFPTEWVYDPVPEQSPLPESETQSAAPSDELMSALGSEADELLQIEGRLLDQLATLGVTGAALADTARNFSSTRSQLTANTKLERRKSARGRHQPENPQTE